MIEKQKIKEATTKNNPKPEPEIPTLNFQALFNFQPKKDTVFWNSKKRRWCLETSTWKVSQNQILNIFRWLTAIWMSNPTNFHNSQNPEGLSRQVLLESTFVTTKLIWDLSKIQQQHYMVYGQLFCQSKQHTSEKNNSSGVLAFCTCQDKPHSGSQYRCTEWSFAKVAPAAKKACIHHLAELLCGTTFGINNLQPLRFCNRASLFISFKTCCTWWRVASVRCNQANPTQV